MKRFHLYKYYDFNNNLYLSNTIYIIKYKQRKSTLYLKYDL